MPRSIGAICLFLAAFTATTHSGGLFGTGGVHAESDRACPKVTEGLRSKNVESKSVVVKFVGFTGYPVDLYWVDWNGSEGQREELFPGSASERRTFPGHVFRARQSGSGILLTEFTADSRGKQIVRIEPCDKAKEAYKVEDWTPRDIDLSLVHDQAAPCEPAGKSSQWSCVRKIPPEDVAARNKEQYGFQEADALESNRECARERELTPRLVIGLRVAVAGNLFDTTDNGYSNKNHRLQVSRVTQGPGYLKMSYDPELFKILTGWAKNHSSYWHHENPVSRVDYDNTESIAGCYANTHVSLLLDLRMAQLYMLRHSLLPY